MKKGIRLNSKDNVGVVVQDVNAGEEVDFGNGLVVTALDSIALPHKLALVDIEAGSYIIKYGEIMGYATQDIPVGRHVHDHNCDSEKLMK
ncbi:UxaA family hydrolase [Oscillibacter sp. GMB15532]|uniref:UxaA family hydrolase n=1 Tax=Oscillibacter sp. GMB15532 TaxID=3230022 RepID=UPI0034DEF23A